MPSIVYVPSRIGEGHFTDFQTPASGSTDNGKIWAWNSATSKFEPITPSSGGTPGGSTTQVQYNSAGAFAGDSGMTYDATNDALTVVGRVVTPIIRPASDSTTAVRFQNAAGTTDVWVVDTTNNKIIARTIELNATGNLNSASPTGQINIQSFGGTVATFRNSGITYSVKFTQSGTLSVSNFVASSVDSTPVISGTLSGAGEGRIFNIKPTISSFTNGGGGVSGLFIDLSNLSASGGTQYGLRLKGTLTDAIMFDNSSGTVQFAIGGDGKIKTNQAVTNTNTPSGATAKALPLYDTAGTLLGYVPVYASQW